MPDSSLSRHRPVRALLSLLGLSVALSGCASVSDTISPAFVDPARYDLWDCKQLAPERKNLVRRIEDLDRLMAKAETGAGGAVVAELAYRNDYIAVRGQQKLLEETWRRDRCKESDMEAAPPPPARPTAASVAGAAKPAPKSGTTGR